MSDVDFEISPDALAEQRSDYAWMHVEETRGLRRYPIGENTGIEEVQLFFRFPSGKVVEIGPGRENPLPVEPQAD